MKIYLNLIVAFTLSVFVACGDQSKNQSGDAPFTEIIKLKTLDGEPIDLKQLKGKTVFLNVWATWCKPCIKEMPSIQQAQVILKGKDIEFLFASNESKEQIESFAEKRKLDLHYVHLENLEALQAPALPATYILNSEGEVAFFEAGYRKWDEPANIELLIKIIESHD